MKNIIKGLCLLSTFMVCCSTSWAANRVANDTDSVFVVSEEELINGLKNAVLKYRAAHPVKVNNPSSLSARDIELLKYQMLISMMARPVVQYVPMQQPIYVGRNAQGQDIYRMPTAADTQTPINIYPNVPEYIPMPIGASQQYVVPQRYVQYPYDNRVPQASTQPSDASEKRERGHLEIVVPQTHLDTAIFSMRNELQRLEAQKSQEEQQEHLKMVHLMDSVKLIQHQTQKANVKPIVPNVFINEQGRQLMSYFMRQVFFRQASAELDQRAKNSLNEAIQVLKIHDHSTLYLTGYASPEGNKAFNEALTAKRAKSVYNYLVAHGIRPSQLRIVEGAIDTTPGIPTISRRVDIDVVNEDAQVMEHLQ